MELMSQADARQVYIIFRNKEPNKLESDKKRKMANKFAYDFIEYLGINGMPIDQMDFIFENCLKIDNHKKARHLEKGIQQRTLKKFHHRCSICGKETDLTVHHILAKSDYPHLKFRINNLMIVCNECHKRMHGIPEKNNMFCIGDKHGIE